MSDDCIAAVVRRGTLHEAAALADRFAGAIPPNCLMSVDDEDVWLVTAPSGRGRDVSGDAVRATLNAFADALRSVADSSVMQHQSVL